MKVLLHTCCAPCLIYPLEVLRQEKYNAEAYFYNPNIYPEEEFLKRKDAFLDFAKSQNITAHIPEYNPKDYFSAVTQKESPARCHSCWDTRLIKTAKFAKENGFTHFTTALLVSPYQDIEEIRKIGEKISRDCQIEFLFRDFRPGFRQGHTKARELGIYCQKYCGCLYSLEERKQRMLNNKATKV